VVNFAGDDALVIGVVESVLGDIHGARARAVTLDSNFRVDLGFDSLSMVELVDRVSEQGNVVLADDVLETSATPRDLARAVHEARRGGGKRGTGRVSGTAQQPVTSVEPAPSEVAGPVDAAGSATLAEALVLHAETHPDQVTIRLLGATEEEAISYGELLAEAKQVARGLIDDGIEFGDRVALMLPTERSYFSVFCGALLAGGVPVPLYPPLPNAPLADQLKRIAGILRSSGSSFLVTIDRAMNAARLLGMEVPSLRCLRTPEHLVRRTSGRTTLPEPRGEDLALIQYTSGSTGNPKGVTLTNAQLMGNIRAMAEGAQVTSDDVVVSWLPLYHDMGLIGMWHAPLVLGLPLVVMSPLVFLARPIRWLEAITTYRGTISAAPNFAYQSCVDRIPTTDLVGIDLSSWRLAFNGSEQVSLSTIEAFIEHFGPVGFRRATMCPAYGLAEAGVGVTFSPLDRGPHVDVVSRAELARSHEAQPVGEAGRAPSVGKADALTIVGCGYPLPGYEVKIADDKSRELPDRHEGRVLCRGPSVTSGYFANFQATRELFQDGWLDTGDLGYVAGGELFLTGRTKDVVIRAGRNLHPEDLEGALCELAGIRQKGVAVFASADPNRGTERLVIVAETDADSSDERAAIEAGVRKRAVELLGDPPDVIVLVRAGAIRRTANGKIRRAATRDAFEHQVLDQPARSKRQELVQIAVSELGPAARRAGSALGTWTFAAYAWAMVALLGIPVIALVWLPLTLEVRWRLVRSACRSLSRLTGITVDVDGTLEKGEAGSIVVANHPSFIDAVVLILASQGPLAFVTSTDFELKPVIGPFLRRIGCAFIARGEPGRVGADMARLEDLARRGSRVTVFPEGSIARAPGLRPFHLGAFALSAQTRLPIVPVAIRGSRDVVRPGTYLPRRADVSVVVGESIGPPEPRFASEAAVALIARQTLAEVVGEPLLR
jgi:1-acyl-sn-glycerol-3-phosphate acyltransferase